MDFSRFSAHLDGRVIDFSRFSAQLDASTIEHSVQPLIDCLNRRIPGSNLVPYILGFVLPTEENGKTMVFINTTTWTVDTAETPSDYIENVMTSLRSSSPPLPITSGGADDDSNDSDDGDDDDDDGDDDEEEEKVGPATKEAIETIPVVEVVEPGRECSVCLAEFDVGAKAKEMPCKHVYHTACIDKWLGICGFCPLCRYSLPMILKEDEDDNDEDDDDDDDDDDDEDDDDDDDNDDDDGNADVEEEETIEGV